MAAMQLEQQANAAVLNCRNLNDYVKTSLAAWSSQNSLASGIPRQLAPSPTAINHSAAGTSSFGMSGTNAHLIAGGRPSSTSHVAPLQSHWQRARQAHSVSLLGTLSENYLCTSRTCQY